MTTDRQKRAVAFCESVLGINYSGNLEDFRAVSNFLYDYLDQAITSYSLNYEY